MVDVDLTSDELEEIDEIVDESADLSDSKLRERIKAEVDELREYAALAQSITVNQKAVKLGEALDQGFERLREIGAPEKAIIFTDSTRTGIHCAPFTRRVVAKGSCSSTARTTAPRQPVFTEVAGTQQRQRPNHRHPRSRQTQGTRCEFRDRGAIMIATEAAAEGINLQFCSMLVNYDLPWNPQRVEQRIGRVHRFGQQHNVIVVNFSNKGNLAEQRILELLTEKFHLFEERRLRCVG